MYTINTVPSLEPAGAPGRTFGLVSTFPPTSCGIATFAAALAAALTAQGASVSVVRCGPSPTLEDPVVTTDLVGDSPEQMRIAAAALNATDVAIVQHEYGLYDGPDGESVLALVDRIDVPVVVVAHTVLAAPTANQHRVLAGVCQRAQLVVVMTETARERLLEMCGLPAAKVVTIPHGAATPAGPPVVRSSVSLSPRVLTWGLLGPGKGIEWAIDAMCLLADLWPAPNYLVAGATHPKVLERSGEAYRQMLVRRVEGASRRPWVSFDNTYRDLADLNALIQSADVVVLPYDSDDQVTSGVLVDAVAAGRPVVATAFPHAVELLSTGAGIVVPQRDPAALADAIRTVLTRPGAAAAMADEARRLAPQLSWESVARRYDEVARRLMSSRPVPVR